MNNNLIYIISSKSKTETFYKIGITNDIEKRIKSIKTGNQYPVKIEYLENIDSSVDILKMERWIHSVFSNYRMEGEWFSNIKIEDIRKKIYKYLLK